MHATQFLKRAISDPDLWSRAIQAIASMFEEVPLCRIKSNRPALMALSRAKSRVDQDIDWLVEEAASRSVRHLARHDHRMYPGDVSSLLAAKESDAACWALNIIQRGGIDCDQLVDGFMDAIKEASTAKSFDRVAYLIWRNFPDESRAHCTRGDPQ